MNFTPAQQSAIETKNCTLLVAAGAGSGKTRVLTERIINRLFDSESNTDITRFLIVTFTQAAGLELYERIRQALIQKNTETPSETALKNIALLPQAKICTIDSFCYEFVRDNFQKLSLSPNVRIAESSEINVIVDEVVSGITEEKLASTDDSGFFYTLYDAFSGTKNDKPFTKFIGELYNKLQNLPSPEDYLNKSCNYYSSITECGEIFSSSFGVQLLNYSLEKINRARAGIADCLEKSRCDEQMYKKFSVLFENDIAEIDNLISSINSGYDSAVEYFKMLKFGTCQAGKLEHPEANMIYNSRKGYLEPVKELKKHFFTLTSEELKVCAADCANLLKELSEILLDVDKRVWDIKKNHGILSFSDVERLTLRLLYDDIENRIPSHLANETAKNFDELYIDEYQDVNSIQDMMFYALSRKNSDGDECGRFLVGDAKQSIYAFRGASPDIFLNYRDTFSDIDVTNTPKKRLFMSNNFRCSEQVIDFTNFLFERIMPGEYDENEKLIYSRNELCKITEPVHVIIGNTDALETNNADDRVEIEAELVFKSITQLLDDPNAKKSDGSRFTLNDIAILTSRWDLAITLEKYFTDRSVAVICEKGESFFERREIKLALGLLRMVDNPEKDIYTAGVLRSAIGVFNDDDLVALKLFRKNGSLFSALREYAQIEEQNNALQIKSAAFLKLLSELRTLSRCCSVSDFIRAMYSKTDLLNICAASSRTNLETLSAASRKKNLMMLYDIAKDFDKTMFKGLSAFLEYVDTLKSANDKKSCSDSGAEAIRIMTIHKSKGLEFPVCYLFKSDIEKSADRNSQIMSDKYGIAFKLNSYGNIRSVGGENGFISVDTPMRNLIREEVNRDELLEYKRLLYVAETRAKDRLYITATPKNCEKMLEDAAENPEMFITNGKTFLEWILGSAAICSKFTESTDLSGSRQIFKYISDHNNTVFDITLTNISENQASVEETASGKEGMQPEITSEYDENEYNPELLEKIKADISRRSEIINKIPSVPPKLTVSQLKYGLLSYEDAETATKMQRQLLSVPTFIAESSSVSASEKGTAMHVFMQFADYASCENSMCEAEADRLCEKGFITGRQKEMLDFDKLNRFFSSPLYEKIRCAQAVFREKRFNLKVMADEVIYGAPDTNDYILVQGVIDCFIINSDGSCTVIDFKTDRVSRENGKKELIRRYSNQLSLYCQAVHEMTGYNVKEAIIFSFSLMEEIKLSSEDMALKLSLDSLEGY